MAQKRSSDSAGWIETSTYYGVCRRTAGDRFRFNERRKEDTSVEPPSVLAILRQLRVLSLSLETPEARVAFLDRLNAAVDLAHARNMNGYARELNELANLISHAGVDARRLGAETDRRLAAITAAIGNI
jgi:recombinational DNA repair ATPase RecF